MKITAIKSPHAQVIETDNGTYLWLMAPGSKTSGVFLKREQIGERDGFLVVEDKEENLALAKAGVEFIISEIAQKENQ